MVRTGWRRPQTDLVLLLLRLAVHRTWLEEDLVGVRVTHEAHLPTCQLCHLIHAPETVDQSIQRIRWKPEQFNGLEDGIAPLDGAVPAPSPFLISMVWGSVAWCGVGWRGVAWRVRV